MIQSMRVDLTAFSSPYRLADPLLWTSSSKQLEDKFVKNEEGYQ